MASSRLLTVGTAGTTDHGAIDDLNALADMAEMPILKWMHVDGAYGGALVLAVTKTAWQESERAPFYKCGFSQDYFIKPQAVVLLLVKDKAHFKYLLHHADYLNREH